MSEPDLFADSPGTKTRERDTATDDKVADLLEGPNALATLGEIPRAGQASASTPSGELGMLLQMAQSHDGRDPGRLLKAARRVGEQMADLAMYSWVQGGKRIEGPTVLLMESLAIEYRFLCVGAEIVEVQKGDRVIIRGMVTDLINCSVYMRPYMFTLPPAPGKFAESDEQSNRWETMQVQSALSKAVRTALVHALPAWYVDEAVKASKDVLKADYLKGLTVEEATLQVFHFFEGLKVEPQDIEDWLGAHRELWTVGDIVDLRKLGRRLKDGDTTVEAEFAKHRAKREAAAATSGGLAGIKGKKKGKEKTEGGDGGEG